MIEDLRRLVRPITERMSLAVRVAVLTTLAVAAVLGALKAGS